MHVLHLLRLTLNPPPSPMPHLALFRSLGAFCVLHRLRWIEEVQWLQLRKIASVASAGEEKTKPTSAWPEGVPLLQNKTSHPLLRYLFTLIVESYVNCLFREVKQKLLFIFVLNLFESFESGKNASLHKWENSENSRNRSFRKASAHSPRR